MGVKYDFSGYATKNNLKCSDGRTILKDAFKDCDGTTVPLVWQHQHDEPANVLGHALLENREDGVYTYGTFNDSESGKMAKILVEHGDIKHMSIYANQLKQDRGKNVLHGAIREVSLVLAGANPGALIDFPVLAHSGEEIEDEAIIYSADDNTIALYHEDEEAETVDEVEDEETEEAEEASEDSEESSDEVVEHADREDSEEASDEESGDKETIKQIFDKFTEKQKKVVYFMIGQALEQAQGGSAEEGEDMKHNVFDNDQTYGPVLSHSDIQEIFADAKRCGSLRDAVNNFIENNEELAHSIIDRDGNEITYGIANIDLLFPEYKALNNGDPEFIKRPDEWVSVVMGGVHHTPFSRVKSLFADITMEDARAKGYFKKGTKKEEEVISLFKRETPPTTIYKKQKLDRDDVIDIVDFDVVSWLKAEMRMMLDEEIARAILVGDGRSPASNDKINELCIRPIWTDEDVYTIPKRISFPASSTPEAKAKRFIKESVKARKDYRGSGNPVLFTTEDWLTEMLLLEDGVNRSLYSNVEELATKMRVSKIVTVPVMENLSREVTVDNVAKTYNLMGIIVNLADYNVGADKGGAVAMFDDFDIDYNQQKYLIETRCSGAMIKPYSAIVLEYEEA